MQLQSLVKTVRALLADPRRMRHGNIRHNLEAIVVIGLCTECVVVKWLKR